MAYIAGAGANLSRDSRGVLRSDVVLQERYTIIDTLGLGGMGAVYKARDLRFPNVKRMVAIKEMQTRSPDPETREVIIKSFEREADNLASLDHPAIPKIYDYFNIKDRAYLVMEHIHGRDLETILEKTPGAVTVNTVYGWAIALCDVLHYLHSHKPDPIVFRDVKPANIMVDQHDNLRLIDFGIAKTLDVDVAKGTLVGSPGYAPPEQYQGQASPRGDIYALGGTLHHLLTRTDPRFEKPFSFVNRPIRELNPDVSQPFADLIMRALAYDPEERFVDAALMKAALEQITPAVDSAPEVHERHQQMVPPPAPDPDAPDTKEELKLILKQSPLLRALMSAAPELMVSTLKEESYPPGTILFRQGDPGDRVYAIWSGRVRVQYEMGTGVPPLVIGDRGPGTLVGEMALLEDAPRSATIQVIEDARLVSLSREDFERLLTEPKISRDVLRNLSQRLRASDEQLIEASRSVEFLAKRIAGVPGEAKPGGDTASSAQAQQWDGLNALFRHLSESTEDLMSGLRLLRARLPDGVDEETEDLLSLLRGSGRRLTSHLSRIRDWQQLEGGTLKIEAQLLDVKDLAEQVIAKLTPSAKMLQLNLKLSASPKIPNVRGDAKWLSVALTEIIQNAINHAPPNSDINVNIDEPEWGKLRVAVTDAGPGVPADYREVIFEPFVRAPGAQGGGLGLGLSLARTIAQAHGGELRAEPGPRDQGAAFVLDLPALSATVAELKGNA